VDLIVFIDLFNTDLVSSDVAEDNHEEDCDILYYEIVIILDNFYVYI